jgi:hypothetical protein
MDQAKNQAVLLSKYFLKMAQSVSDFHFLHWNLLTDEQHKLLSQQQKSLLQSGESVLVRDVSLPTAEVKKAIDSLQSLTVKIRAIFGPLEDIQKGIGMIVKVVNLIEAAAGANVLDAVAALEGLERLGLASD